MSSPARTAALVLGLIAFALLGYAWFNERQSNADLRETVQTQSIKISRMANAQIDQERAFYFYLLSEESENRILQIADTPTPFERQRLVTNLSLDLLDFWVQYGAADEVVARLDFLVAEDDAAERVEIANDLIGKIGDMAPFGDPGAEAVVTVDEGFAFISTLVAVLGSVGSALASAFLFLTGGGRRKIEQDMLAIDLEKQKVELAQMQYEAREAIAATTSIQDRSET